MSRVYLDNNATTPLHDDVLEAMLPFLTESFGNPSSTHSFGREARQAIESARERVAAFLRAKPSEILFTSGGTEANNLALLGAWETGSPRRDVVTDTIEHPAVSQSCRTLESRGSHVTCVPVDASGRVSVGAVAAETSAETRIVSIMLANNDTGTIQPVKEIAGLARERGVLMHTDAVQAPGKIPVDVAELGVDLLCISAHKFNGPKGVGALYVKEGTRLDPLIVGGSHEKGMRAGTENVAGIIGLGKACELAGNRESQISTVRALRDTLEQDILSDIAGTSINGDVEHRLPNTSSVTFDGIRAESLLMNLDLEGIAVSAGSACSSGAAEPSHVLLAMGLDRDAAAGTLRFSLGPQNTGDQIDRTLEVLRTLVAQLRSR